MFLIGDFANLARVSTRVLRHYDRIGLLPPARVDPRSGYRYYRAGQLADLNQIVALRDLGFGLKAIADMSEGDLSPSELRGMLTLRQAELDAEREVAEHRLRMIESRIMQLEEHESSADLVRKSVSAMTVWTKPYETATIEEAFDALSCMVRDMSVHIDDLVPPYGLAQWTAGFDEERFAMNFGVPIDARLEDAAEQHGLVVVTLPAVDVISSVRASDRKDTHLTNAAIGQWIEDESAEIAGPIREVLLADPIVGDSQQVIEVQVPVRLR